MAHRKALLGLDVVAGVAVVIMIATLAMVWYQVQVCPIFAECGPWEPRTGWSQLGPFVAGAVLVAGLAYALIPHAAVRRIGPGLVFAFVVFALLFVATMRINVFANEEGPFTGYFLALGVAAIASAALLGGGGWALMRSQGPERSPTPPAQSP